jgi:CHAT domain-containing protein/tetratricopeptide (TPR) repeat protein
LRENPYKTFSSARGIFAGLLTEFQADPVGFDRERIRCLEIYAQLSIKLAQSTPTDSLPEQLDHWALEGDALWALQNGIDEARKRELPGYEARILIELSDLYFSYNDLEISAAVLIDALKLAKRGARDDLIWRIHWRLGRLAMELVQTSPSLEDSAAGRVTRRLAEEWFETACGTYFNLPARDGDLGGLTQRKHEVRTMIELALLNSFEIGDHAEILRYSQLLNQLPLLEAVQSRVVPIKFERRKFLWGERGGTVPFLRSELQRLKREAVLIQNSRDPDSSALSARREEILKIEDEYFATIEEVVRDDPEFASLFTPVTFAGDTLRRVIEPGDAALQILDLSSEHIYGVVLNRDSVSYFASDSRDTLRTVLRLLGKSLSSVSRLYVVLPPSWKHQPFEQIITEHPDFAVPPAVFRLPDLQSLVILKSKQAINRGSNVALAAELTLPAFSNYRPDTDILSPRILEDAGNLLLYPEDERVENPLDIRLFTDRDQTWRVKDLFGIHAVGNALIFIGDFEDESLLAKIGFFAGFSSVIFMPKTIPQTALNEFLNDFLESTHDQSPGKAFLQARRKLQHNYPEIPGTLDLHYYGNGGLDLQQRRDFADRNFASTVLMGNYNLENGDGVWAMKYYDRALSMVAELDDPATVSNLHQLRIKAARVSRDWSEAIRSQLILNEFARSNGDSEALETGLRNLSVYYANAGEYLVAIGARGEARRSAEARGNEIQTAEDDRILSTLYESAGEYENAREAILMAGQTFYDWEETGDYVTSGIYLGRLYLIREDYSRAVTWLEDLYRVVCQWETEIEEQILIPIEYYQHLGLAYEGLGDYGQALAAQLNALDLAGDSLTPASAITHQYLAGIYWKMGKPQDGLDHSRIAYRQFTQLDLDQYVYLTENTEALIYLDLGNRDRALEKAKSALQGAMMSGDLKSRSQIEKNIGLIELVGGEAEKAKQRFHKALRIDKEMGSLIGQAYSSVNLGNAYLQLSELDSARVYLATALEAGIALPDPRIVCRSDLGLGLVELEQRQSQAALDRLQQADSVARQLGFHDLAWRIDLAAARVHDLDNRTSDALLKLDQAMERVEVMRAAIVSDELKSGFMENKGDVYRLAVSLNLKQGDKKAALNTAERARSRAFLDLLKNVRTEMALSLDPMIEAERQAVSARLSSLHTVSTWLQIKGSDRTGEDDALMQQTLTSVDSLQTVYARLLQDIESHHPGYRDLVAVQPESSDAIISSLAADEALLEYFFVSNGLMTFVLRRDGIQVHFSPISADTLFARVSNVRYRMERTLSIEDQCRELFHTLIAPVVKYLSGVKSLIIVPEGSLHYLPFAALRDKEGTYLIDNYALSFAPSASVFLFCRNQAEQKPSFTDFPVLALVNPSTDLPLESLFFAEKEAVTLSGLFPGAVTLQALEAAESKLRIMAPNTGLLHIASHGVFDSKNPEFSTLFLAPQGNSDGRLEMHEIFGLHLDNCSLITLSACESAMGGISGGDEIIGLNRAFIYAGSPRVLSTLWEVDDLSTAVLMKKFYRHIKAGLSPSEALRLAQQHVRQHIHSHPAYWAAFVLTGEPGHLLN